MTLLPPSTTDGEQRQWHGNVIAPAAVDARALQRRMAWLAVGCLVMRYVSEGAARRPAPDRPRLLWEFDHELGRPAYRWVGRPDPDAPQRYPRRRSELSERDLNLAEARPSEAEPRSGEAAAWGPRPGTTAQRPKMRLVSWKPIAKGTLRGFATVELPIGLKLIDRAVFVGTNGTWARPPAKPQLDKDGRQRNHCFACGAHGEVIEFLRRYDNPDCGSAVVKLASALAAAIREHRSVIAAFATAGGPS